MDKAANTEKYEGNVGTFGWILGLVREDFRFRRKSWNAGIWVYFETFPLSAHTGSAQFPVEDCFALKTEWNTVVRGWRPDMEDMLASDWGALEY